MKTRTEFIHNYGMLLSIASILIIVALVFLPIPKENHANANYAMGYISGVLTAVVTFYFGGVKRQTPPNATVNETTVTETKTENQDL